MSSELQLPSTARNLVSVSGFGYGENVRLQQVTKIELAAAQRVKRFDLPALHATPARPAAHTSAMHPETFLPS
jgi:hypothetical protein